MIRFEIKPRSIEIFYDTGRELKYINYDLRMLELLNEVKNEYKNK